MSEQQNSSAASEPDKNGLWGWWYDAKKWQNDLHRSAAHKALDIPEDMGDINAPKTMISSNGIGWKEMAVLGALGLGGWHLYKDDPPTQPLPTQISVPDTAYDVLFFDKDGNPISVPQLPKELEAE